jgi:outer membrane biogenesis lipoprotein LolB
VNPLRLIAAWLLASWLGGCALAPPSAQPLPALRQAPVAFEMSGRLSVRLGDRSDIARLRWTHRASSDLWVIASPLGNEVARLQADASGATLSGPAEEKAASFAALTEKLLGVALEPSQLADWLHGKVPAETPGGWSVTLDETQAAGEVRLAKRLTARRGDVLVRLVVDDYRPLED